MAKNATEPTGWSQWALFCAHGASVPRTSDDRGF
jgi:hypothetical protein